MKRSQLLFNFVFSLATVFLSTITSPYASAGKSIPASIEQTVRNLKADLAAKGYKVAQGHWNLFKIEDCQYAIKSLGNCLGNNPTAPYIIPSVPLWPDEYVDKNMKDLLGPTLGDTWWTYRLDEREALVVVGLLPPPGAYFGIQTYLFTRKGHINTGDRIYHSLTEPFMQSILFMKAPNPSRILVFSSLGNSNNNVVIERQSGAAFNQERSFIITPDEVMESELTEALLRAGVPERKHIFTEPVSADLGRLGLGPQADDLVTVIRYALPNDEAAGENWRNQIPLVVLRVRDMKTDRATRPYPRPIREERRARSELELKGDVQNLVKAVKQQWGQKESFQGSFESLLLKVDLIGEHCLKRPMNCLGDTADADYQIGPTVNIDSGEVLAVVGTLGTATGNATYTSLSINRIPALVGALNVSHKDLAGTASAFSTKVSHSDKLYVQYFARDCGNLPHCLEVSEEIVPRGDGIKIIQRNYVVPGTARGPNPEFMVNPSIIVLDGRSRPAVH